MHLSGKLPSKQGIPMKDVVDNHFDRSGVKALRDAQLTDTNNLIDFIHFEDLSSNSMRICDPFRIHHSTLYLSLRFGCSVMSW